MQSSILSWALPSAGVAEGLDHAQLRADFCDRTSLPWPPPKRGRGKPTLQKRFVEALYNHVLQGDWQILDRVKSAVVPVWWEPGLPVALAPEVVDLRLRRLADSHGGSEEGAGRHTGREGVD